VVITEHKEDLHPQVVITDPKTKEVKASYSIPVGAHLSVSKPEVVTAGTRIAKAARNGARTQATTGRRPRRPARSGGQDLWHQWVQLTLVKCQTRISGRQPEQPCLPWSASLPGPWHGCRQGDKPYR